MKINKAEQKQDKFYAVLNSLSEYSPRDQKYTEARNTLIDNAKSFCKRRKKLLTGLKIKYFQFTMIIEIAGLKAMMKMILEIIMVSSIT